MSIPLCKLSNPEQKEKFEREYCSIVYRTVADYYNPETDEENIIQYYSVMNEVDGAPSAEEIHKLVSSTYQHAKRRINLFPFVDRHSDGTLRCCYSNEILETADCVRIIKCNEEHALPQSWHAGSSAKIGADMHLIFACGTSTNSFRGNFALDSKGVLSKEGRGGKIFVTDSGRKVYEPNHNTGAIARAVLYALVMYPQQVHETCLPRSSIAWLVEKANTQKVSEWEKHRNAALFQLQHNRNPFIDHPEWVSLVDFTKFAYSQGRLSKAERKEIRMQKRMQTQLIKQERKKIKREQRTTKRIERNNMRSIIKDFNRAAISVKPGRNQK